MSADLTRVRAHLTEQISSIAQMRHALEDQEQAIRTQNAAALVTATSTLQGVMVKRLRLESERDQLLTAAATTLGCRPSEVTVKMLVAAASPTAGAPTDDVQRLSEQMRTDLTDLQTKHEHVREMINSEMGFAAQLVRALNPTGTQHADAYGRTGAARNARAPIPASLDISG
jgi:hypothetical protein